MNRNAHLNGIEAKRQMQNNINNCRKEENEIRIKMHSDAVSRQNFDSRQAVKNNSNEHELTIDKFRNRDLNNK